MAKTKPLNTVEERILTMALMSGLTGKDLVRIGGQLDRRQRRSQREAEIAADVIGWQWSFLAPGKILLTAPSGDEILCSRRKDSSAWREKWTMQALDADRVPQRLYVQAISHLDESQWPQKIFPEKSSTLYLLICGSKNHQTWKPDPKKIPVKLEV